MGEMHQKERATVNNKKRKAIEKKNINKKENKDPRNKRCFNTQQKNKG